MSDSKLINQRIEPMTHGELVEIAYKWVLMNGDCGVAFKELNSHPTSEIPDVIGFNSWDIALS